MRNPFLAAAILAALAGTACSRDTGSQLDDGQASGAMSDAQVDPAATNVPGEAPVAVNTGTTGSNPLIVATEGGPAPYLANSAGSALYTLQGDTDGSKCDQACTHVWPPMTVVDAVPTHTPGLEAGNIGTIQRADGSLQVTYAGHPLYHYAADGGAGHTAGHGVSDKWGQWSLVSPQGTPVP
ncbi:MAG: hypothetical protein M3Y70_10940 [Pseudomonadota bacterium]|nr:hypothetical protein [Pseudomonadota bacterium]